MTKDYNPFDFMNAASFSKANLIGDDENPEMTEKLYAAYIVNRGFANFDDTILHANEMNMRPDRKSTRLNSSHPHLPRMPSSA